MARPKSSKDVTKRKVHKKWTTQDGVFIKQNWNTMSTKEICEALNLSKSAVNNAGREFKLPFKSFTQDIIERIHLEDNKRLCGIYCIYNPYINKCYIGSSVDCIYRIKDHLSKLKRDKHYNKFLQKDFNEHFYFGLFEHCDESELLNRENFYINKYSTYCTYNQWSNGVLLDIKPYLDRALINKSISNYSIDENGCWNYMGRKYKEGYGRIVISINNKEKYLSTHKVKYYEKTGEYPELLRHTCNNRQCMNPDHLVPGSYKQNNLDQFIISDIEFERVWLLYRGDRVKITNHFNWKKWSSRKEYSPQVSYNEQKLGLIKKHTEILREDKSCGSRGPTRKNFTNMVVGKWKCLEGHFKGDDHLWECNGCGDYRINTVHDISRIKKCGCLK